MATAVKTKKSENSTIVLNYDIHNPIAQKTLDYILSLGIFKQNNYYSSLVEAYEDIKNNRIYTAKNGKDLIEQCLK